MRSEELVAIPSTGRKNSMEGVMDSVEKAEKGGRTIGYDSLYGEAIERSLRNFGVSSKLMLLKT